MGQGQADVALQVVRECAINGDWVCLKNLHLVTGLLLLLILQYLMQCVLYDTEIIL